ncbi:hypothetical protein HanRHA438_Chr12g0558891 [Helianthus annuus]|nr:hypothetical protein HanRHA438_Chr12g0558891 [Helianthus annuus]
MPLSHSSGTYLPVPLASSMPNSYSQSMDPRSTIMLFFKKCSVFLFRNQKFKWMFVQELLINMSSMLSFSSSSPFTFDSLPFIVTNFKCWRCQIR